MNFEKLKTLPEILRSVITKTHYKITNETYKHTMDETSTIVYFKTLIELNRNSIWFSTLEFTNEL